jgi:hypothetical protein
MGRTGLGWLRIGSSGGLCEHGDEPSVHKESRVLFDKLSNYQLSKEYSALWSK